jgi:hypothetical protein
MWNVAGSGPGFVVYVPTVTNEKGRLISNQLDLLAPTVRLTSKAPA